MPRKIQIPDNIATVEDLIRHMVSASGKSGAQVSREIGRSDNYLWSMLRNGTIPGIDLFVTIANACGYSVEVSGPSLSSPESFSLSTDSHGDLVVNLDAVVNPSTDSGGGTVMDSETLATLLAAAAEMLKESPAISPGEGK